MKKIAKLKKKLTVRMLSFIMAAGLLLLVVPFMAIAAGREDPNPGKSGDFSLFKGFSATTYEVLSADQQVYPEITAEDIEGATYQWQVYSYESERYVPLSGSKSVTITENLAARYCNDSRESYFRCVATDAEGNLLISDVLTVVLPKVESVESESQETEATRETVSTISLLDATTQPEDITTQPADITTEAENPTTEAEISTTEAEISTTEATNSTQPTQPAADQGEEGQEGDGIEGQLLKPLDGEEEAQDGEGEPLPLRGMLLVPLGDAQTTYTVVYYVENANDTGYSVFKTEQINANVGDSVDLSSNLPGTTFDTYLEYNSALSTATGTVAADGASEFSLYFSRKRYTFTFLRDKTTNVVLLDRNGVSHTINSSSPYVFTAKYGESLIGLWPENSMFTTLPSKNVFQRVKETRQPFKEYYSPPPVLDSSFLTESNMLDYDLNFTQSVNQKYTANYYLQDADGTTPGTLAYSIKSSDDSVFNPNVVFDGFTIHHYDTHRNTRGFYYLRDRYTLTYDANGGSVPTTSNTLYYDETISFVNYGQNPTRSDGYEFAGWYYQNGPKAGEPVAWDSDKMPMYNVTIYAKWNAPAVTQYTVTVLYYEGGSQIEQIENVPSGTAVPATEAPTPTREGYTRDGTAWYYRDNGGTEHTFTFGSTPVTSDITLYAKWTINSYNLIFHIDENTSQAVSVEYDTTLRQAKISDPEKTGYTFGGWYYDSDWENSASWSQSVNWNGKMPAAEVHVYAKWTINTYSVKFYNDSRTSIENNLITTYSVEYNKTIAKYIGAAPLHYGQPARFGKWVYLNNGTETDFTFGADGTHVTGNMRVYATWINIYTVTFLVDEGLSAGNPQNVHRSITDVDDNTVVAKPDDWTEPTKKDYTFDKWFYDNNGTPTEFKFSGETGATVITSNLTVYPTWRKNEVKLTISNEGANANIFTVQEQVQTQEQEQEQEQGFSMKVAVPAGEEAVIAHLPFGTYTVAAGNWDFRYNYQIKDAAYNPSGTFTANEVGQEFTFIATSSRNTVMWLGESSMIALFNPVTGN